MGRRPSSIDQLPEDIRDQLNAWLRDGRLTQRQITAMTNAALADAGEDQRVTKSSINRYAQRMEDVGAKLRESREVAKMWIDRLGAQPQGEIGHLINETARTLAFDVTSILAEGEMTAEALPGTLAMLKDLALTMQRLEKASSENVKREAEIRRQEREKIADEVGEEAIARGFDEKEAAFWRGKVLGVR